ncbi:MAG: UvrD-helicase domain-containing protein [Pirellulaceae bacterium]
MNRTTANNNLETLAAEKRDAKTRLRIGEELDKNFMVEAAAGTGKTTSIVNRMVSLVAGGACQIEQLAAVTFTRKAAAELRGRFQAELRRRTVVRCAETPNAQVILDRLLYASDNSARAFVGTIHSFCASLLRERPVEFGVDPAFRELDEKEDMQLRQQAWLENISDLIGSGDPLIDKLDELGLDRHLIKKRFNSFIEYRDVDHWPHALPPRIDIEDIQRQTRDYIDDMRKLIPLFPTARGSDKLMDRYETIVRSSGKDWRRLGDFFNLLERFDTSHGGTQKFWSDKTVAKSETQRWQQFRDTVAKPAMQYWCRVRYQFVVDFLRRAVSVYERLKMATGGLDFNDLLLTSSRGLKSQPELRKYFQSRYTHVLVDEFQDTDPIQAEMILYLASANVNQQDWQKCAPKPGSLFLVGDPKQSIYRFRRGDIVTYNRVKEIFQASGGEVLALVKNFRSRTELREWNNRIFQDKFLPEADRYTPAAENMVQGRVDAKGTGPSDSHLCGVYKLSIDTNANIDEATEQEADAIARFIRHAIDSGMSVRRTEREIELGRSQTIEARDFLIIPWGKKRIGVFRTALEAYGIPCEVTGGNAFSGILELSVLIDCLRAIDDPHNPVLFLSVLRDGLFGFSDRELYRFKKAGGRFAFTSPVPEQLDKELKSRFQDATGRFKRYQGWLRALPFTAAVSRVAEELGLLSSAAAGSEGNVAAGGLLKALEWLRQQSFDFDSASDLITFLEELLKVDETEGCTALPPDANVVRVMNLHKAKGLEAPIVFLADTSMKYVHPVLCHIDRSGNEAVGYTGITAENGKWATKDVATPENWQGFQEEEQRYLNAEANRLLYVATTRAANAMIISTGKGNSNWSGLHRYLNDAPEIEIPSDQEVQFATCKIKTKRKPKFNPTSLEQIELKWATAAQPNFKIATAKELGLKGRARPSWETSGDYGYKWGSAMHELLEICTKSPKADLRSSANTLASEYELGSERVDELFTTVESVTKSDIWKRAQAATHCFSELPFETAATDDTGKLTIIRGVIDLIFEEPDGWVIVDYKTDDLTESDIPAAISYYCSQLAQYANHWTNTSGNPTKELGLYFTKLDCYESLP